MYENLDKNILGKAKLIELVIFDVDGVLTNGGQILGESGDEYKIFHSRDGLGLVMLRESGCHIAGGECSLLRHRSGVRRAQLSAM